MQAIPAQPSPRPSIPLLTCHGCVAHCCRYVAMEIPAPRTARDHRRILGVLQHPRVAVTQDHDRRWYVEFAARCGALTEANRCGIYAERPRLCREYRLETCPRWNPSSPHRLRFDTAEIYLAYLARRGRSIPPPPPGRAVHVRMDPPRSKRAWDEAIWMVLHEETRLIVDRQGRWFVEFDTGQDGATVAEPGPLAPYRHVFESREALIAYLEDRAIAWRFASGA